jgi:hypothetical protein
MAAVQIAKHASRCKAHPRLKADPTFCAVAVYRGSWEQPDLKFATDIATSVAKGDAPNFDMPKGTSTEIFDMAADPPLDTNTLAVDATNASPERVSAWSSALFPSKPKPVTPKPDNTSSDRPAVLESPLPRMPTAPPSQSNPQDRELFVRRSSNERAQ